MVTVSRRTLEITKDTTLNGGAHDSAILVCSQPVTLTPAFVDMGSSFACTIVNLRAAVSLCTRHHDIQRLPYTTNGSTR